MATNNRRTTGDIKADDTASVQTDGADLADTGEFETHAALKVAPISSGQQVDELEETGEFPPLDPNYVPPAAQPEPPLAADERVSFWLKHLESEIQRLQAKWDVVANELRERDLRIEQLAVDVQAKDSAAESLRRDLAAQGAAAAAVRAELDYAQTRIGALEVDRLHHEDLFAARGRELDESKRLSAARQADIARATAELEELTQALAAARLAIAAAGARHDEHVAANNQLRGTIQELEAYIDGRQQSWAALNAKLAKYQDSLATIEGTMAATTVQIAERDVERQRLDAKIAQLERSVAELTARGTEQEAAAEQLRGRLAEQGTVVTELKTELAAAHKNIQDLGVQAERRGELVATLEHGVERRDKSIAELEQSVEQRRASELELGAQNIAFAERVAELEKGQVQRDEQLKSLQHANTSFERDLSDERARVTKLEAMLRDGAKEISELQDGVNVRDRLIDRLKNDLAAKQEALDLLDRSVQRLTDLGASLDGLDRKFSVTEIVPARLRPVVSSNVVDIGAPLQLGSRAAGRRMIVALEGGERTSYPLQSRALTIGRSVSSDIRISSPFISRLHARISTQGDLAVIEDLGSKNGILVNSQPIGKTAALKDGDIINLGGTLDFEYIDLDRPARGNPLDGPRPS